MVIEGKQVFSEYRENADGTWTGVSTNFPIEVTEASYWEASIKLNSILEGYLPTKVA